MKQPMKDRYGRWAVVTGASSGIGEAWLRALAAQGLNVAIAARRSERLEALASEARRQHGVEIRTIEADLSTAAGIESVVKAVADVDLGVVVSNAGATNPGAFLAHPVADRLASVNLNVVASVDFAHQLGTRLVEQGRGAIIFTGSTSAYSPVPMLASYAASKAFVGSFAQALHMEWKPHGVDVMVCHPGPTRTEMVKMDGVDFDAVPIMWMTADQVVAAALKGLGRKSEVIPGVGNRMQRFMFTRLMPRRLSRSIWATLMKRVTDRELHSSQQ